MPVRSLVCTVEPFNHLLIWPKFPGYFIIVGKPDDLGDIEPEFITEFAEELLGGQGICTVTIGDEPEVLRKLLQMTERHPHGKDARTNTAVIRYLIPQDGTAGSIHDEPDISLDTADFDISLIGSEYLTGFVTVIVNEGLDAQRSRPAIVSNALVGDTDTVEVFQGLPGFPEGKPQVHMKGKAQGHGMGVKLGKPEGGSILRQAVQVQLKEIHRELAVDVVELVFILAIVLIKMLFINLFEIVQIVRAFWINTFMDNKVFSVFLVNKAV